MSDFDWLPSGNEGEVVETLPKDVTDNPKESSKEVSKPSKKVRVVVLEPRYKSKKLKTVPVRLVDDLTQVYEIKASKVKSFNFEIDETYLKEI